MSAFLIYAIKSAILLALLFVPGIFLMFKEKMFRFNRMTLLAILVQTLVLPLCNFSALSMDNMPAIRAIEQGLIQAGIPVEQTLSNSSLKGEDSLPLREGWGGSFSWFYVVSLLYGIGVMTILFIRLREVLSMGRIIRRGSIWTKEDEDDGIRIYCHAENVAPFSWLRNIVISEADYKENGREIILHEKAHILYHHSLDILLLTLVEAVQWWNPFAYLLGMYLRDVHEYEADDYVLRHGISCHAYSELVIRKAVGANSYTFANNFNHSLTKKRINMMHKTKPKGSRRSRVLYVLPMIALALSAFATPEFSKASSVIEDVVQTPAKDDEGIVIDCHINSKHEVTMFTYNGKEMDPAEGEKILKGRLREGEKATVNITSEIRLPKVERDINNPSKPTNLKINYKVVPPESESNKQTVIDIHIDSDDKLSCGINHAKPEPISPKDMMELLAGHKGEPTVINITSEKELDGMEHIVREACRKDGHLRINYEVKRN